MCLLFKHNIITIFFSKLTSPALEQWIEMEGQYLCWILNKINDWLKEFNI